MPNKLSNQPYSNGNPDSPPSKEWLVRMAPVALRKLLEAKDAAVRSKLNPGS